MAIRSLRIPYVVAALAVPAALVALAPVYLATMDGAAGRSIDLVHPTVVASTILALYAAGVGVWFVLRLRLSREVALAVGVAAFLVGTMITLYAFGHRRAGEVLLVVSVGGLAISLPRDVRACHVLLRGPGRGAALYILATTELPALAALAIATRSYIQGADSAAATYGTTFFLILTYLLGYVMWSFIRSYTPVWALFTAAVVTIWGFPLGMFFAFVGRSFVFEVVAFFAPIAGLGGVAACLPYLWDHSRDDDASVLDASG